MSLLVQVIRAKCLWRQGSSSHAFAVFVNMHTSMEFHSRTIYRHACTKSVRTKVEATTESDDEKAAAAAYMHAWQDEIVKEEEKEDVKEEVKEEYVEVEEEEEDMHDMHGMLNEEEKMILKEGHDRCFLKRIFAIYAEHRPTVPMDEVVETVDQVGSDVKDFYQALCTMHGLAALRPTWEPDDSRPDWVPEFLLRDRSGVVDAVPLAERMEPPEDDVGPSAARPKHQPMPKVVIRPAKVPYKAPAPEPIRPVVPPPPPAVPPVPVHARVMPPPPRPVQVPVAWWPPVPPPAAKPRPRQYEERRRKAGSSHACFFSCMSPSYTFTHARKILAGPIPTRASTTGLESKNGSKGLTSSFMHACI